MAKVNKMEKQVNNLEKHVGKGSKVRYLMDFTNTKKALCQSKVHKKQISQR